MSSVPYDVMAFDLERGLSKALGVKVETFVVDIQADIFKFRIGQRWRLELDSDALSDLWDDTDSPSALKDKFNLYKAACLAFMSFERR